MSIKDYAQSIVCKNHQALKGLDTKTTCFDYQMRFIDLAFPAVKLTLWLDKNPDGDILGYLDEQIALVSNQYRTEPHDAIKRRYRHQITTLYDLHDHVTASQVAQQVNH